MRKKLLKLFSTFLLTFGILLSINALSSRDFKKDNSKIQQNILFRQYTINIQSIPYYIGGCSYTFTAVITIEWDGVHGHLPTNIEMTNGELHQNCPNFIGYARNISTTSFSNQGEIKSLTFTTTEDPGSDSLLNDANFNNDIKTLSNEEIKKIEGK